MPTVQRYGGLKVGTTPLPRARKTAAETPESLGANVERARGDRAGVVSSIAAGVARFGANKVAEIRERERNRADEIAVLTNENAFVTSANTDLAAALERRQGNAVGVTAEFDRKVAEQAEKIRQSLGTQRQKDAFDKIVMNRRQAWKLTLERHEAGQVFELHTTELVKGIQNDANEAVAAYKDPAMANLALTRGVERVKEHAKYVGMGPEALENQVRALQSAVHVGAIEAHIADGNDEAAKAWFEEAVAEGQIQSSHLADIKAKIDTATTAGTALRASDEIWKQFAPATDEDAISLDRMEAVARERFANDPKALTATIQRLRERKAGVDEGRRERKEEVSGKLWAAVADGANLSAIEKMPEYSRAPGELQERVKSYVVREAEQRADRSYMLSERTRTARDRAKAERERKEMAAVWTAGDPLMVDAMTENQILSLLPDIGADNVRSLLAKKKTFATPKAVQEAKIDNDLFLTIAHGAGLKAYNTPDADKAMMGELRNQVETEIDRQQRAAGKTLGRPEKEAIMRSIIDKRVMIDNWMGDEEKIASLVSNPTDVARAFVPLDRIPQVNVGEAVNTIRRLHPSAQRLTDQQILTSYKTRIQRAFAAHVLGLGLAEIERRLQGQ